MRTWGQFEQEAPELAAVVRAAFTGRKHHTMATLRRDGSPRISGTEVQLMGGELTVGSMPGALKARDLQRDGRVALHSATVDPPEGDESGWAGEAKLAGVAEERPPGEGGSHSFRVLLAEVVHTRVDGDVLVVTAWHEGRGVEEHRRT